MFNLLMIILLITICQGLSSVKIAEVCKFTQFAIVDLQQLNLLALKGCGKSG